MGNFISNQKKNNDDDNTNNVVQKRDLKTRIDTIASKLILETNNTELTKLLEVTYCNIVLNQIENSLDQNYTKIQLDVINGIITNKPNTVDTYIKLNTDNIEKSIHMIENSHVTKKSLCKNISLFYTKIVHLYSAIYRVIGNNSICSIKQKKIHKVKKKDMKNTKHNLLFVKSNYCKKNEILNTDFLYDEVGIPELEELYKDQYDEEKKEYIMSEEQKIKYQEDVDLFYKTYTGKDNNGTIKSFSDIPIFDYKLTNSLNVEGVYEICNKKNKRNSDEIYVGFDNNTNLKHFADFMANIMNKTNTAQNELIQILENDIFEKINDTYIIHSKLTMEKLNNIIEKVRNIIVQMFVECEEKYQKAIQLFKTIVFDKNISISKKRLKYFKT